MKQLSFMKASFMGDPGNKRYNNHQIAMKGGSYSLAMTGIVLAILVVVNIFASVLPTTLTQYDISSTKLYSITSNTKVVVNALKKDGKFTGLFRQTQRMMSLRICWPNMKLCRNTSRL